MLKHTLLLSLFVCVVLLCQTTEAKKIKEKPRREVKLVPDANLEPSIQNGAPHQEFAHDANGNNQEEGQHHQKLVKPKSLKVLSEYEKCKLGCKEQRDKESAHEYVERLREELKLAEQQLSERDDRVIEL